MVLRFQQCLQVLKESLHSFMNISSLTHPLKDCQQIRGQHMVRVHELVAQGLWRYPGQSPPGIWVKDDHHTIHFRAIKDAAGQTVRTGHRQHRHWLARRLQVSTTPHRQHLGGPLKKTADGTDRSCRIVSPKVRPREPHANGAAPNHRPHTSHQAPWWQPGLHWRKTAGGFIVGHPRSIGNGS